MGESWEQRPLEESEIKTLSAQLHSSEKVIKRRRLTDSWTLLQKVEAIRVCS